MEANGVVCTVEGQEGLEEDETKVSACGIAGEDDLVRWHRLVERARGWVEEREVGREGVDERRREWVLGRKAIADGEGGGAGQAGQVGEGNAVAAGVQKAVLYTSIIRHKMGVPLPKYSQVCASVEI